MPKPQREGDPDLPASERDAGVRAVRRFSAARKAPREL
jgi:hypothetical protein